MKLNQCPNFLFVAILAVTTSGCATYRVSSNVESAPMASFPAVAVLLSEDGLPGRKYTEIGLIEVSVKKLTIFDKDPTKAQADQALIEKARFIGADAVINIKYMSGIGLMTWGYMDAKGIGVKVIQ